MQAACAQYSNVVGFLRRPVRLLHRVPADRPEPRVRDELVRPREHGDRVELHGADPPQHPGHAAALRAGPEKSLRVKGDPPHLVGAQRGYPPGGRARRPFPGAVPITGRDAAALGPHRASTLIIPNGCG